MKRVLESIRTAAVAAVALGVAQAVVETLVIAALYAGYLWVPEAFFNIRAYDAYLKIYAWLGSFAPLPGVLETFLPRGFAAKLPILGDLLWVGVAVGAALGVVGGLLFAILPRSGGDTNRGKTRAVIFFGALALAVHLAAWWTSFHQGVEASWGRVARNMARNFVFDGTALAIGIEFAAVVAAILLVRALASRAVLGAAAIGAIAAALWSASGDPSAHARAIASTPSGSTRPADAAPAAAGYNVVLISIDSLRADHLGAYGYAKPTSPTIDALAAGGVLFRNASSTTSWTLPGHMSILTGRTLLGHGMVADDRTLTSDVALISESMKAGGYRTGAVVSAPYVEARYGFSRGFDEYDDRTINYATHGESYKHVTAPLLIETAEKWLTANARDKFFLFLHFWDVHYDYAPGAPYERMFDPDYTGTINGDNFYFNSAVNRRMAPRDLQHVLALYDGEIRLVDDHIAKLRAALERLGVAERTILVVTADHGDEFFEHGKKGHHRTLYDEVIRVPFVVYVPGAKPARNVVTMESSTIDIMPTILGLVGLPIPAGVEGADLSEIAMRGAPEWDRPVLSELYRRDALNIQASLRRTGKKVIHHFNRRIVEAYDVAADPAESRNVNADSGFAPGMIAELGETLNGVWPVYQGRVERGEVSGIEMDDATLERLRALGYIGKE